MTQKGILGVVGGMGSVAAAHLFARLVELTPAQSDQNHLETFIHNNAGIPDRTEYLLSGGLSPLPELQRSVRILNDLRADVIILACVTSTYFIDELAKESRADILDTVKETVRCCQKNHGHFKKFGILASTGTLRLGMFQRELSRWNLEAVVFDDLDQLHFFTEPIYAPWGIKAGHIIGKPKLRMLAAIRRLEQLGAEAVIAGCSELPLVLSREKLPLPVIDSIDCLCYGAIKRCLYIEAARSRNYTRLASWH